MAISDEVLENEALLATEVLLLTSTASEAAAIAVIDELEAILEADIDFDWLLDTASEELPVKANKLALRDLGSTTTPEVVRPEVVRPEVATADEAPTEVLEAMTEEAWTWLLEEKLMLEVSFLSELIMELEDISALAAVSMLEATAAVGAVLGRCRHLCRLKKESF